MAGTVPRNRLKNHPTHKGRDESKGHDSPVAPNAREEDAAKRRAPEPPKVETPKVEEVIPEPPKEEPTTVKPMAYFNFGYGSDK